MIPTHFPVAQIPLQVKDPLRAQRGKIILYDVAESGGSVILAAPGYKGDQPPAPEPVRMCAKRAGSDHRAPTEPAAEYDRIHSLEHLLLQPADLRRRASEPLCDKLRVPPCAAVCGRI